ncbi:MAG: glyoxalase family protein [Solirubrobacteraceae bacterium]|nr:glyoxalase family protein [Solirubrobacteraceae bacterium]
MKLEGIHHITAITADAPRNVDFYARVLGLRMVKKTVNQDDPTVYHLFYADEQGSPGADLTFFEYPGMARGRAGAGMVHRIAHRVADSAAIGFWEQRLSDEGVEVTRDGDRLLFADPEGLEHELLVNPVADAPLTARSLEVPPEYALQGFDHVRASTSAVQRSVPLLRDVLGFQPAGDGAWEARGDSRGGRIVYDDATAPGMSGGGTVHHVAWAAPYDELEAWQQRVQASGAARPTPIIDRFYFRSVYFREPSGVLFELASIGPGFTSDEPAETLGEGLSLPPRFEPLRDALADTLTPLPDTRRWRPAPVA